jgi:hypothetical protein
VLALLAIRGGRADIATEGVVSDTELRSVCQGFRAASHLCNPASLNRNDLRESRPSERQLARMTVQLGHRHAKAGGGFWRAQETLGL